MEKMGRVKRFDSKTGVGELQPLGEEISIPFVLGPDDVHTLLEADLVFFQEKTLAGVREATDIVLATKPA